MPEKSKNETRNVEGRNPMVAGVWRSTRIVYTDRAGTRPSPTQSWRNAAMITPARPRRPLELLQALHEASQCRSGLRRRAPHSCVRPYEGWAPLRLLISLGIEIVLPFAECKRIIYAWLRRRFRIGFFWERCPGGPFLPLPSQRSSGSSGQSSSCFDRP